MTPAPPLQLRIVADTPCVPWTGRTGGRARRPVVQGTGRRHSARRAIYECCYGPLPPTHVVVARCTSACVEPTHLDAVTRSAMTAEAVAARTPVRGEAHGAAKLTAADVADIRHLYRRGTRGGPRSSTAIAARYDIHPRHVRQIAARVRWARPR